jgi:hypothetical protein
MIPDKPQEPSLVAAQVPIAQPPQSPFVTVEELLRLDAQAAVHEARRKVFAGPAGDAALMASDSHPVVQAIYGMGRSLTAEVSIGGQTHIFKSASRQSLSGGAQGYQLERIVPPCIYLSKAQNQEVSCLDLSQP